MFRQRRKAIVHVGWWFGIVSFSTLGFGVWGLSKTDCSVEGKSQQKFTLDVDFDTFRQILVRTNATAAILEHGGMKLVNEKTEDIVIDLSKDSRPLRNFLRGKSKADITAIKHLTVQLNDPQLNATELLLTQNCRIQREKIHIVSSSDKQAGELRIYNTTLDAVKVDNATEVTLSINMTVDVCVSRIFLSQAAPRVQKAAEKAMQEQKDAMRNLVANVDRHAIVLTHSKR